MNTKIKLLYRDANNYKKGATVIVGGAITARQIALMASKLDDGVCIIAEQVGLPSPIEHFIKEYGLSDESDHVFTEMEAFSDGAPDPASMLTVEDSTVDFTIDDLTARFESIESWDEASEWERLQALD